MKRSIGKKSSSEDLTPDSDEGTSRTKKLRGKQSSSEDLTPGSDEGSSRAKKLRDEPPELFEGGLSVYDEPQRVRPRVPVPLNEDEEDFEERVDPVAMRKLAYLLTKNRLKRVDDKLRTRKEVDEPLYLCLLNECPLVKEYEKSDDSSYYYLRSQEEIDQHLMEDHMERKRADDGVNIFRVVINHQEKKKAQNVEYVDPTPLWKLMRKWTGGSKNEERYICLQDHCGFSEKIPAFETKDSLEEHLAKHHNIKGISHDVYIVHELTKGSSKSLLDFQGLRAAVSRLSSCAFDKYNHSTGRSEKRWFKLGLEQQLAYKWAFCRLESCRLRNSIQHSELFTWGKEFEDHLLEAHSLNFKDDRIRYSYAEFGNYRKDNSSRFTDITPLYRLMKVGRGRNKEGLRVCLTRSCIINDFEYLEINEKMSDHLKTPHEHEPHKKTVLCVYMAYLKIGKTLSESDSSVSIRPKSSDEYYSSDKQLLSSSEGPSPVLKRYEEYSESYGTEEEETDKTFKHPRLKTTQKR